MPIPFKKKVSKERCNLPFYKLDISYQLTYISLNFFSIMKLENKISNFENMKVKHIPFRLRYDLLRIYLFMSRHRLQDAYA